MNEIGIYKNASEFIFITPTYDETYNKSIINQIVNAWKNGGNLDAYGRVWVDVFYLSRILRTNKNNARYLVSKLTKDSILNYDGKQFVKGTEIGKLIDMGIQHSDTRSKEKNLRVSRDIYNTLVDSHEAQLLRTDNMERMKIEKKQLKKKRIKTYKIKNDELTNETLDIITCQFSHIRSWSIYQNLGLEIENGLIVNQSTHDLITKKGINDEEQLVTLCVEMGWNTTWYKEYKEKFC